MSDIVPTTGLGAVLATATLAVPKAISKLIDTLADEIVKERKPRHTTRQAAADAEAELIHARGVEAKKLLKQEGKWELEDRAAERARQREIRQYQNVEAIAGHAAKALPGVAAGDSVSDTPVDPDWKTQFFTSCQDVSSEDMQALWGRLLAGEVVRPGTFSLRTLQTVKVMSKREADVFGRFCASIWTSGPISLPIIHQPDVDSLIAPHDLTREDLNLMSIAGLVEVLQLGVRNVRFGTLPGLLFYHDKPHLFDRQTITNETQDLQESLSLRVGICSLTTIGNELAQIASAVPDSSYRDKCLTYFRGINWSVKEV